MGAVAWSWLVRIMFVRRQDFEWLRIRGLWVEMNNAR